VKIKYVPIETTKINNKIPQNQADILAFIGKNYSNPDLKLYDVASHVGISEEMTSDLLRKYCDKNFRQYLNQIRMEEAKRLLKESDLQISEIAFKIGYNNIQHFNRVFKEYTNQSPKIYRES
jgi:AraC-like DNA-binding protein